MPVTIHMPLKDVIGALSTERILKTLEITARDVARYFGLVRPRIAVTGLNPHAGEDGTMGARRSRRSCRPSRQRSARAST